MQIKFPIHANVDRRQNDGLAIRRNESNVANQRFVEDRRNRFKVVRAALGMTPEFNLIAQHNSR